MLPTVSLARAATRALSSVPLRSAALRAPLAARSIGLPPFAARPAAALLAPSRASVPPPVCLAATRSYSAPAALAREDIEKRIFKIFEGYEKGDHSKIAPESYLEADLGLDSLDVIEVLMEMEFEFSILMEDEDVLLIETVKDMIDYVESVPQGTCASSCDYQRATRVLAPARD